jgi:hypothetical protein
MLHKCFFDEGMEGVFSLWNNQPGDGELESLLSRSAPPLIPLTAVASRILILAVIWSDFNISEGKVCPAPRPCLPGLLVCTAHLSLSESGSHYQSHLLHL